MTEKYIKTEWGNVFYKISELPDSARKTLFFLHGLTADHTMFEPQIQHFSEKFNIIAWDAPAHGRSRPFAGFTYEKAACAVKQILDAEAVTEAVFIGQSMGGFITQAVIKRYPETVSAFAAIDSTPYGEGYYSRSDIWWLRQVEWMSYLYPMNFMKKAIAKQVSRTKAAYENMLQMLAPYEKKELCRLMGIGYSGFLEDNCDLEIKCPVLLIIGEKDITGKVKAYNKAWAEKTGFHLVTVPNAAHNSNVDDPEAVNKAIEEFIASID